ncbi:MAG: acyl-homoserine-lactone synthase [Nitrospirota bacterium]
MKNLVLERKVDESFHVCFEEAGYSVREIISDGDLQKSYELRHRVFCEELEWVPRSSTGAEIDRYDEQAVAIGVFDPQDRLVAYMRLLRAEGAYMIEEEFKAMVDSGHNISHEKGTAELSRLCIAPEARKDTVKTKSGRYSISVLLLKGIYYWSKLNRVRHLYGVMEHKTYRLAWAKGFPLKLLGEPQIMPDGVVAVGILLDWQEFEFSNVIRHPGLIEWFSRYQSDLAGTQSPRRGSCSPHRAFALTS